MMTFRERILATLKGDPTDCLPYVPRLDLWYKSNKLRGTLPSKYKKATLTEIVDDLGVGYHAIIPDFLDFFDPLDEVDRALGIYRLRTLPYRTVLRGIKRNISYEGDLTCVEYKTPAGSIKTKVLYDDTMRQAGITITHILEHAIKSLDDYEAVAYIFEQAEVQPAYEQYLVAKGEVGDRGVAVAYVSLAGSPMHLIQRELMSYNLFFYELHDHPQELEWLSRRIEGYYQKVFDVVAKSPAEVILLGANYDAQITWPPFFREHITPTLARAADTLHAQGKFLLTHTDGENKGLLQAYVEGKIDVADSICPAPMTQLSLRDVREAFAGKVTVWGGIPSVSVLENSMSDQEFEEYLEDLLRQAERGDHLILSIADTTPPDAKFSRIERIARAASEFGPVGRV
ncbi:uroporphyrinogen decarboxylase (URO-D) [Peptococcaceae bacterium CEB3]|nr:uroporphyrinogen decarboxylase (URO-D) [Peptococcaceae bacterium CEB3]